MSKLTPADARRLTVLDVIFILIMLITAVFLMTSFFVGTSTEFHVYRDSELIARFPLDVERSFTVKGEISPVTILITNGSVRVTAAGCRNQVCVKTGAVSDASRQIVCAPNHIIIQVAGEEKDKDIDGTTQ